MGIHINRRLALILMGFVCIGFLLAWAKFILVHLALYPAENHKLLQPTTLKKLLTPPGSVEWYIRTSERIGLKLIGFDYYDNYALGWFTKEKDEDHTLIYHGGRGFQITSPACDRFMNIIYHFMRKCISIG